MNTDWKLLLMQLICVFPIPVSIGFIVGYWHGYIGIELTLDALAQIMIISSIIILLFSIWMGYIFYNESKKHSEESTAQTIIFGISLIPLILQMSWFIALLCPQIVYWAIKKYSWDKKVKN